MSIIFITVSAFLCIYLLVMQRRKNRIKRWKKKIRLEEHQAVFCKLYNSVDGFALSILARRGQDALEYVYGEIEFESFAALLSLCNPDSHTIFYDLGSGTGKAVLACSMIFNVEKSCGIELFPQLHHAAVEVQKRFLALPEYKNRTILFLQNNFLDVSLRDATLLFINSTAFFAEHWLQISLHLEQIPIGSLVISTSKAVKSDLFCIVRVTQVSMSWGVVNAFIQERTGVESLST